VRVRGGVQPNASGVDNALSDVTVLSATDAWAVG
jgi:hypothetical protein